LEIRKTEPSRTWFSWSIPAIGAVVTLYLSQSNYDAFNYPKQAILLTFLCGSIPYIFSRVVLGIREKVVASVVAFSVLLILISTLENGFFNPKFWWGIQGRANGNLTVIPFLLILLITYLFFSKRLINNLAIYMTFLLLFLSIYGVIQLAGLDPFPWNNPYAPLIGTFGNPNFASAALAAFAWAPLYFVKRSRGFVSLFFLLVSATGVLLSFLTTSIQGLVGLASGILLFSFLYALKVRNLLLRIGTSLLVWLSAFTGILGVFGRGPLSDFLYQPTVVTRLHYWRVAIEMIKDKPFLGWGPDSYQDGYLSYRELPFLRLFNTRLVSNNAHNMFLQWGVNYGVIVASILLFMVVAIVGIYCRRVLRRVELLQREDFIFLSWLNLAVVLAISIEQIGFSIWFWILSGALLAFLLSPSVNKDVKLKRGSKETAKKSGNEVFSIRSLLSIFLLVTSTNVTFAQVRADGEFRQSIQVPGARAGVSGPDLNSRGELIVASTSKLLWDNDYLIAASQSLFLDGPAVRARDIAQASLDSKFGRPYVAMGILSTIAENSNDLREALRLKERMTALDPNNFDLLYEKGKLETSLGLKDQAVSTLMEAKSLAGDNESSLAILSLIEEILSR